MFYILSKGKLSLINFEYLTNNSGNRLEPTSVPFAERPVLLKKEKAKNTFAIEIMSSPVKTLDHEVLTKDALTFFESNSIHHLVLCHGREIKGLVSDRDLTWLKKVKLDEHAMVKQFMSTIILTCHEETPIDHLAKVMVKENISAMPVVNNKKELTGIVTHHDILRWLFS